MQRSLVTGVQLLLFICCFCGAVSAADSERRGSALTGVVAMPADERPENMLVTLSGPSFHRSTIAQRDGSFVFFGVPDGEYVVEVRCNGYVASPTPIHFSATDHSAEIVVPLGKPLDDIPAIGSSPVVSVRTLSIPADAVKEAAQGNKEKDKQRFDRAVKHFRKALAIYPDYFEAWNNLGTVYMRMGKATEAEDAFQNAIRLNPESSPSLRNLGLLYLKGGAAAKAIPLLLQACDKTQHGDVFAETYLGFALYQESRYEEAERCLAQALALEADFLAALYQQGFVKAQLRKYGEAKALFNRALELGASPKEAEQMRYMLGQLEKVHTDEVSGKNSE